MSRRFLRFLVAGGFAALVNLASRYLLNFFMRFEIAVAIAYLIGMVVAYALARAFVFEASGRAKAVEFQRFAVVNVFSLAAVWTTSVGLARLIFPAVGFAWRADDVAHAIGVVAPAVLAYFGHRSYTFAKASAGDGA